MNFKNIITLTQVSDGAPGAPGDGSGVGYYIETNQEEVLRFKNVAGQYTYSPSFLTFKIYNYPKQDNSEQLELTNSSFKLEAQTSDGFKEVEKGEILRLGYIAYKEGTEETEELDLNTVYFNVSSFYAISNQQVENSQNFRFSYLIDNSVASIKIIQMRNGVSEDMAKLNLHASGIDASIQSNRLKFSAEGLSMYKVQDSETGPQLTEVFGFRDGDLYLKGRLDAATGTFRGELEAATGTFSGELQAATGSFSGHLQAKTGQIGGFTISGDSLYAGENIENSPLVLKAGNGTDSEIIADNITLGVGAKIKDRLIFSEEVYSEENGALKSHEAYINNPNLHNGIFIEAGKTLLTSQGFLRLGEIEAFGGDENQNSYIKAGDTNDSSFWEISGDGSASFKEIIVDKATIKNSVLEIGSVQAVGSLMLFKDSWKIIDKEELELQPQDSETNVVKNYIYTLETPTQDVVNLQVDDYIIFNKRNYFKVLDVEKNKIILQTDSIEIGDVIVKLGKDQDYLISILGDSTGSESYASKNSLTLAQASIDENESGLRVNFDKILILGDLSELNDEGIDYETGLFAKNVYLQGALVTQTKENGSYAGINTLSNVKANKFGESDKSNIVFWAGSDSKTDAKIQEAKFQVTENGSIYAAQGIFEGSLITKSVIKGASIHTAKIYGEKEDGAAAALRIYDASNGIQFINSRKSDEEEEHIMLGIGNTGIYTNDINNISKQIIAISNNKIDLNGDTITIGKIKKEELDTEEALGVVIEPGMIKFNAKNNFVFQEIENNNSKLVFGKTENNKKTEFFTLDQNDVVSFQNFSARSDVVFGTKKSQGSLHYQKIEKTEIKDGKEEKKSVGYDLYVS